MKKRRQPNYLQPCKFYFNYPYYCRHGEKCFFLHVIYQQQNPEYMNTITVAYNFPLGSLPIELLDMIMNLLYKKDHLNLREVSSTLRSLVDKSHIWDQFPFIQTPRLDTDPFHNYLHYRQLFYGYSPKYLHQLYFTPSGFIEKEVKTSKGTWKFEEMIDPFFAINLVYHPLNVLKTNDERELGFVIKTETTTYYDPDFCNGRSYADSLYSDLNLDIELTGGTLPGRSWCFYSAINEKNEKIYFVTLLRARDESWCDKSNVDKITMMKIVRID